MHATRTGWLLVLLLSAGATHAADALESHFPEQDVARFLFDHFDIATMRSSLNPARRTEQRTFASVLPAPTTLTSDTFEVREPDWVRTVRVLDRGDFNRDGIEDLLVCFDDRAILGTYNASSLMLVTRYSDDARAVAIHFSPVPGRYPCSNTPPG